MSGDDTSRQMTRRQFVRASALGLAAAAIEGAKSLAPRRDDGDDDRLEIHQKEFEGAARKPRFL